MQRGLQTEWNAISGINRVRVEHMSRHAGRLFFCVKEVKTKKKQKAIDIYSLTVYNNNIQLDCIKEDDIEKMKISRTTYRKKKE